MSLYPHWRCVSLLSRCHYCLWYLRYNLHCSLGQCTPFNIMKCIFGVSLGKVGPYRVIGQPKKVIRSVTCVYKQGGALPHLDTHSVTQVRMMRERRTRRRERHIHKTSYTWFFTSCDIHLSDRTILRKFVGFSPLWFPRGKYLCLVYLLYLVHLGYFVVLVILS